MKVNVAAYLNAEPDTWNGQNDQGHAAGPEALLAPGAARVGATRKVPVELIVNGYPVEKREIEADGKLSELTFDYSPKTSSWVAVRIFPSSHTNPVFVELDGKPIRASKRSAQWCLDAVETCWNQKVKQTRATEKEAARAAYDVAKQAYGKALEEAVDDRVN